MNTQSLTGPTKKPRRGFVPFMKAIPGAFHFAFRGAGPWMILAMPFIWFVNYIPFVGSLIFTTILYTFFLEAVRSAVSCPNAKPEFPAVDSDLLGCLWRTLRLLALSLTLIAPVLVIAYPTLIEVLRDGGRGTPHFWSLVPNSLAAFGVFLFYFPMALLLYAVYDSMLKALNPVNVGHAIAAAPLTYLACLVIYYGLWVIKEFGRTALDVAFNDLAYQIWGTDPALVLSQTLAGVDPTPIPDISWASDSILAAITMATCLLAAGVLGALHRQIAK